jgi:ERCC4-type nuclease
MDDLFSSPQEVLQIVIDSREALASQINGVLRNKYRMRPIVMSLVHHAAYILSSQCAAVRLLESDIGDKNKLARFKSSIGLLRLQFDRIYVIVQDDVHHTDQWRQVAAIPKQAELLLFELSVLPNCFSLFSSSDDQTALLLYGLSLEQQRRGYGIAVPAECLSPPAAVQKHLAFLCVIPCCSWVTAVSLLVAHNYCLRDVINADVSQLCHPVVNGVSRQRAQTIWNFFRTHFDVEQVAHHNI